MTSKIIDKSAVFEEKIAAKSAERVNALVQREKRALAYRRARKEAKEFSQADLHEAFDKGKTLAYRQALSAIYQDFNKMERDAEWDPITIEAINFVKIKVIYGAIKTIRELLGD